MSTDLVRGSDEGNVTGRQRAILASYRHHPTEQLQDRIFICSLDLHKKKDENIENNHSFTFKMNHYAWKLT